MSGESPFYVQDSGHALPATGQGATQNVSIGGSSTSSNAFGDITHIIRLCSDVTCWYSIGASPTAKTNGTDSNSRLPADVVEVRRVSPGAKIAVIQDSTSGTLNVEEAL